MNNNRHTDALPNPRSRPPGLIVKAIAREADPLFEELDPDVPTELVELGMRDAWARGTPSDIRRDLFQNTHDIVSSSLVWLPARTAMVASPKNVTCSLQVSTSTSKTAGLSLTVAGLGLKKARTYEFERSLTATVVNGAVSVDLLIPFWETVRIVIPPGGHEGFPLTFYEHYGPVGPVDLGSETTEITPTEFRDASERSLLPVPVGGQAGYQDTFSMTTSTSLKLSLTPGLTPAQSITGTISASVSIEMALSLPPGSFQFGWLKSPLGGFVEAL